MRPYGFKDPIIVYHDRALVHAGRSLYKPDSGSGTWMVLKLCTGKFYRIDTYPHPIDATGDTLFKEHVGSRCPDCERILGL